MNIKTDWFKLVIVGTLILFLFIYYQQSLNGRYNLPDSKSMIIDTRTGKTYTWDENQNLIPYNEAIP